MNKKKLFVTALAICLIAILSFSTLAWFNAADDVTNTFKVATDSEGKTDFSVKVSETDPKTQQETTDGVTYEDILPGDVLAKDPTITNTGDYAQYIRAYVEFDNGKALKAACKNYGLSEDLRTWLNVDTTANWEPAGEIVSDSDGKVTYVFYLKSTLGVDEKAGLFTTVTIPSLFQQKEFDDLGLTSFTVKVKADALQVKNVPVDSTNAVVDAKEAFEGIGWEANSAYNTTI